MFANVSYQLFAALTCFDVYCALTNVKLFMSRTRTQVFHDSLQAIPECVAQPIYNPIRPLPPTT